MAIHLNIIGELQALSHDNFSCQT